MATRNGARDDALPGSLLLVVHDFVARSADELSLAKGDRIELIERDDDFGDGWFLGRHMVNGSSGLFPEVYTTAAPKGTFSTTNGQRRVTEGPPKSTSSPTATVPIQPRHASVSTTLYARPASAASAQTSPLAQSTVRGSLPSSTATSPRSPAFSMDSPVMNETLSVIDEHITNMNTPRTSFTNGNKRDTMGSVYSTQPLGRLSYIPGHETDEDDATYHTEEEVMAWSPERVAEYLEDHGVERAHCDVFRDQEISGEVLLAMDQSSIFIKEFELGPVGRRLKTWHKIKALQDEVRGPNLRPTRSRTSEYETSPGASADDSAAVDNVARDRSAAPVMPRNIEPLRRSSTDGRSNTLQSTSSAMSVQPAPPLSAPRRSSNATAPLQNAASSSQLDGARRPSAQSIRTMNNSRRHSSMDSTSSIGGVARMGHRKQPSIDSNWQPGQSQPGQLNGHRTSSTFPIATGAGSTSTAPPDRRRSLVVPASPGELDRGYFSSNELDNRSSFNGKKGNVLTKKVSNPTVSPLQSRANSLFHSRQNTPAIGRVLSAESLRDSASPVVLSQPMFSAVSAVHNMFGSTRSVTSPQLQNKPTTDLTSPASPVVTKLEYDDLPSINAVATGSKTVLANGEDPSKVATPSPTSGTRTFFGSQRQKSGYRATSDAVTKNEKSSAEVPTVGIPPTVKEGQSMSSPTRTGSTTPSTDARSFDLQKSTDGQSRASTGSGSKLAPPPTSTRRPRPKTKKTTSAYTRGLEKKTPAEQMATCDYSGWMKKKSGSLMSTWKPRLFVLRGRRLSYYYKGDDKEEKGLIDISFHRVLPAQNETLTGLHAAMTGAAGSPSSPTTSTPTTAQKDLKNNPPKPGEEDDSGLFIFKLVPPKSGLSKGVSFTKPTVHYFAVNSRQEGRLWMAALMRATIDRDEDGVVTTTYNQKTISLAKARARRERPPALKEVEEESSGRVGLIGSDALGLGMGLGIGGLLGIDLSDPAIAGAEKGGEASELVTPGEGAASLAPSSTPGEGAKGEDDVLSLSDALETTPTATIAPATTVD